MQSVPPKLIGGGIRSDWSSSSHLPNRPKTVIGTVRPDCERVLKVGHEPTRKHSLETHLPAKKSKPPPWQRSLDTAPVPCVVTPGYVLARSKTKIEVRLKTDDFFEPVEEIPMQVSPERDELLAQLQQQIDDLTLFLEEERLNHRDTKRKAAEQLRDKVDELHNQHANEIRMLLLQHTEDMEAMKNGYEQQLHDHMDQSDSTISKMKGEIEFLQGAFESYKSQLHQETDEKWRRLEAELKAKHHTELQERLHELKAKILAEKNLEKSELVKEHQKEVQSMKKEHKKEMEGMMRRFANAAADLQKLKETQMDLKDAQRERDDLRKDYDKVCEQVAGLARDLTDTKVKLASFEQHFGERVDEINERYKSQMHDLMSQNTDLRQQYMKKCGELYDEKVVTEEVRVGQVRNARESLKQKIEAHTESLVSQVTSGPSGENKPRPPGLRLRPSTAPRSTETDDVVLPLTDHETDKFVQKCELKERPQTRSGKV